MAEIATVTLAPQYAEGWVVPTRLPNVFTVAVGPRQFTFQCRLREGEYRICGPKWELFVRRNTGAAVTLYAGEGDNAIHRLEVRR